jgi:hypothetical protein
VALVSAVKRPRTLIWAAAVTAFCALLIGYFAWQSDADQAAGGNPHDRANHHPRNVE